MMTRRERESDPSPLSSHFAALRMLLLQIGGILALGTCFALFFTEPLFQELLAPFKTIDRPQIIEWLHFENNSPHPKTYTLPSSSRVVNLEEGYYDNDSLTLKLTLKPRGWAEVKTLSQPQLALFSPAEGLILSFKLAFWSSVVLLSPLWLFPLWHFLRPALHPKEARLFLPFLLLSLLLMALGALLALKVTLPLTTSYFFDFNLAYGKNLWGLSAYVDYWLTLMSAHMLSFEGLAVLLFLIELGHITASNLKKKRRLVVVASLILGAALTPPDVISQLLLAIPLIGLFELALMYAIWKERERKSGRFCRADRATLSTRWPRS